MAANVGSQRVSACRLGVFLRRKRGRVVIHPSDLTGFENLSGLAEITQ